MSQSATARAIESLLIHKVQSVPDDDFLGELKATANNLYKNEQYLEAVALYSRILASSPSFNQRTVSLTNRAQCWLRVKMLDKVLTDCDEVIQSYFVPLRSDPSDAWSKDLQKFFAKAVWRRAQAFSDLGNRSSALRCYLHFEKFVVDHQLDKSLEGELKLVRKQLATLSTPVPPTSSETMVSNWVNPVNLVLDEDILVTGKWTMYPPAAAGKPSGRTGMSMVAVHESEQTCQLWLFGGRTSLSGGRSLDETWTCKLDENSSKWIEHTTSKQKPLPRYSCTMVGYRLNVYLFGRCDNYSRQGDSLLWKMETKNGQWVPMENPKGKERIPALIEHGASICVERQSMLVYGGCDENQKLNGILLEFHFKTEKWSRYLPEDCDGPRPDARRGHLQWCLGRYLYVMYGQKKSANNEEILCDDFWRLNTQSLNSRPKWKRLNINFNSPVPRHGGHAVTLRGAAYVFGGVTFVDHNSKKEKDRQFLNDVGRYIPSKRGGSWSAVNVKGDKPSIRADCQLSTDGTNIIMMGGHCRTAGQPHVYSRLHQLVVTQPEDDMETEHLDDIVLAGTDPIPDYIIRMRTTSRKEATECNTCKIQFGFKLTMCGRRCGTYYCSRACQEKDWPQHVGRCLHRDNEIAMMD
ncbi:hypothetical protein PROFUN_00312 [Planoprotostelium fungivorum]|uniref:MYND-type domain-containing protein n=1 Tax=Planoprotostelium fungivorum TaxID=1890364 RepID=A0A2P6NY09_9EUKA|nr:hypothetical protein PROFUN_00312 [Planoprotostelium fungivorum]